MEGKQQLGADLAQGNYRDLVIRHDSDHRALWCYLRPNSRPCYTTDLLTELTHFNRTIAQRLQMSRESGASHDLRFLIFASRAPGVFNLGGDLALFLKLIRAADREGLLVYAKACIELLHIGYHLPITTISLVQGDAFGGGFESALTCKVVVAEKRTQMGLPEILFNLFPGMGAYSLLARKLDPARAERMILSGRMYSAEELYEMGLVDVLAENDQGEEAVYAYMKKYNRAHIGYEAVHKVRRTYDPISYDELMSIVTIWVDAALQLGERDLRVMERIAHSQEKLAILHPSDELKQLA